MNYLEQFGLLGNLEGLHVRYRDRQLLVFLRSGDRDIVACNVTSPRVPFVAVETRADLMASVSAESALGLVGELDSVTVRVTDRLCVTLEFLGPNGPIRVRAADLEWDDGIDLTLRRAALVTLLTREIGRQKAASDDI